MHVWSAAQKRLIGISPLDYDLVDYWLSHLVRGRFRRDPIAARPPVQGERLIGWIAHYLIGIAFAAMLLAICGLDRAALIVGIGSVGDCLRDSGSNRRPKPQS
jgi:hypothetical protein